MQLAFQLWPAQNKELPPRRIALLHGMGGTGALWRPIAASLENDYWLMAFDQRGHGKSRGSQPLTEFTPLDFGQDIIETIDAQGFHPTWLIGHSMGVRTACAAAHLRPDWIQGLILIDLGLYGPFGGGLGDGLASFLRVLPERFSSRAEARAFMNERCPDPSIAQYLMAVSKLDVDGSITFPFDHSALIHTITAAAHFSAREWIAELGRQGMPILILRGANSLVWSHEEFEEERKHFAPYSSITFKEYEGAGHGLPFEQRQRFVVDVRKFIETPTNSKKE